MTSKKADALTKGFALPKVEPKRTELPEPTAQAFENPAVPNADTEPAPKPKASRLRRDKLGERVAVYLPPKMAERLRVRCAKDRRSVSDAVTEAVDMWLKS